ncbi:MAG TPA: glutathione S-transferase [Hyphomicrobiaceae bacterium]|nr:glutathione S-transferase [Hyphomicrobiaceae bacterium]
MKLIETKLAPNPRRVRIFLAEKGVAVRTEELDLMKGDLKTPEFTAINPMQRVPVLILDDGTALSETMAICRYFEETVPNPPLMGRDAKDKAIVEMWNRRIELGLFNHIASAFRHLHPAMAKNEVPQVAAWGEANKPKALEQLAVVDQQLAKSAHIAGDSFSVADITALVAIDFMRLARIQRPPLANLDRWYAAVSARPSAKA